MPPKSSKIRFDDLGNVIFEEGELAPSDAVLQARAMVLQGQEARADSDAVLNTELVTPEQLKAFVGGRNDLSTEALVNVRLAEIADKTQKGLSDKSDELKQQIEAADLEARRAAVDAALVARNIQLAVEDGTVATNRLGARVPAGPAPPAPAPPGPAPAPPAPGPAPPAPGPAPPAPAPPGPAPAPPALLPANVIFPKYASDLEKKLRAAGEVAAADALFDLASKTNFYRRFIMAKTATPLAPGELDRLKTVAEVVARTKMGIKNGANLKAILAAALKGDPVMNPVAQRAAAVAGMPTPPATPILVLPGVPAHPVTPPIAPKKTGQTGSGVPVASASNNGNWRAAATRAMDLADTGDKAGALRMLADLAAAGIKLPADKSDDVYAYILQ